MDENMYYVNMRLEQYGTVYVSKYVSMYVRMYCMDVVIYHYVSMYVCT